MASWAIYFWGQPPTRCSTPSACRSCCCGQSNAALTQFLSFRPEKIGPRNLRSPASFVPLENRPFLHPQLRRKTTKLKATNISNGGRPRHGQLSFAFEVEGGQQRVRNFSAGCTRSTGHRDQAPALLSAHSAR